ncbi:MAG: hypothetical protein R3C52_06100 [Hyphomonadaceae bacterium]
MSDSGENMQAGGEAVATLKTKVETMSAAIVNLGARLEVLEKLMVNDEARLAAEIERLRDGVRSSGV